MLVHVCRLGEIIAVGDYRIMPSLPRIRSEPALSILLTLDRPGSAVGTQYDLRAGDEIAVTQDIRVKVFRVISLAEDPKVSLGIDAPREIKITLPPKRQKTEF